MNRNLITTPKNKSNSSRNNPQNLLENHFKSTDYSNAVRNYFDSQEIKVPPKRNHPTNTEIISKGFKTGESYLQVLDNRNIPDSSQCDFIKQIDEIKFQRTLEDDATHALAQISQNQEGLAQKYRRQSFSHRDQHNLSRRSNYSNCTNKKRLRIYSNRKQSASLSKENVEQRPHKFRFQYQSEYAPKYQTPAKKEAQNKEELEPWESSQYDEQIDFSGIKNHYYRNLYIIKQFDRSASNHKNSAQNVNQRLLNPIRNFKKENQKKQKKMSKKNMNSEDSVPVQPIKPFQVPQEGVYNNCTNCENLPSLKIDESEQNAIHLQACSEPLKLMNTNDVYSKLKNRQTKKTKANINPQKRETLVPRKISLADYKTDSNNASNELNHYEERIEKFLPIKSKNQKGQKQNDLLGSARSYTNNIDNKKEKENKRRKISNSYYQMSKQAQLKEEQEGINYMQFWVKHRFEEGCIQQLVTKLQKDKFKIDLRQLMDDQSHPLKVVGKSENLKQSLKGNNKKKII